MMRNRLRASPIAEPVTPIIRPIAFIARRRRSWNFGSLEALEVDGDDPIEQDRVRVPLDDRGKHRLLLVLDESRGARDQAQPDHLAEERPDAPEVASAPGREDRGNEVSCDHELRPRRDRGHDLRGEAREEPARRRLPDEAEGRSQNAGYSTNLAPLGRSLYAIAASPEDQAFSVLVDPEAEDLAGPR